jgi:hypothetical protein
MLFPDEDIRRRYDIQETKMSQLLADCFGVEAKFFQKWSLEESSGCLGQELRIVLERSCSVNFSSSHFFLFGHAEPLAGHRRFNRSNND